VACDNLASGESCTFTYTYTVQANDSDPLVNTATVHYHPSGFPNDIYDSDTWTVDSFQPSVNITKRGPALSKATDDVTYTITIENTSSADAPNLVLDSFSDSLVPDVTPPAACDNLASGASCTFTYDYTVKVSDPDPLVNTATVHYHSVGVANDITDFSTASVNLFQPGVDITKTGPVNALVDETITYNVKIDNTSSADAPNLVLDSFSDSLVPGATPPAACNNLATGASCSFTYTYTTKADDFKPTGKTLDNTATVHYHPAGFPNDISDSDTWKVGAGTPPLAQHVWQIKTNMPHKVTSGGFETLDSAVVTGRLSRHCGYMVAKFRADGVVVDKTTIKTNYRTLVKLFLDGTQIQSKIGKSYRCPRTPVVTTAPTSEPTPIPADGSLSTATPAPTVSPTPDDPSGG
jgi:uncharacterized repeat protein (TIGR01451 family)